MRTTWRLALVLTLSGLMALPALAGPRRVPGYGGAHPPGQGKSKDKPKKQDDKPATPATPTPAAEALNPGKGAQPVEMTPALALASMIYFEMAQGVVDYAAEVIETSEDLRTGVKTTDRKQLFYRAPATTLTLMDGQALNFLDAQLFRRFLDGVDLAFVGDEQIDGVDCMVVKVTPREGAFKDNEKWYYLAKDDFRKIRIRAIKSDSIQNKKFWFINDFSYKLFNDKYLLPLNTRAQLLTWENIPMSLTTAVFTKYSLNQGLEENFFLPFVQDAKFNDTYKD